MYLLNVRTLITKYGNLLKKIAKNAFLALRVYLTPFIPGSSVQWKQV